MCADDRVLGRTNSGKGAGTVGYGTVNTALICFAETQYILIIMKYSILSRGTRCVRRWLWCSHLQPCWSCTHSLISCKHSRSCVASSSHFCSSFGATTEHELTVWLMCSHLTRGIISRTSYYEHTVTLALVPLLWDGLYDHKQSTEA